MARVPYVETEQCNERTREVLSKNGNKNIFRILAHSQSHLINYCRLGSAIRFKGALDPVLRELAITRTGILCNSDYEVIAHKRIGMGVGVTAEQNEALHQGAGAPVFSTLESSVLKFTDEVVQTECPSAATFNALAGHLSTEALVELHLAIGYYIMTSKFLRAFDVDLEATS